MGFYRAKLQINKYPLHRLADAEQYQTWTASPEEDVKDFYIPEFADLDLESAGMVGDDNYYNSVVATRFNNEKIYYSDTWDAPENIPNIFTANNPISVLSLNGTEDDSYFLEQTERANYNSGTFDVETHGEKKVLGYDGQYLITPEDNIWWFPLNDDGEYRQWLKNGYSYNSSFYNTKIREMLFGGNVVKSIHEIKASDETFAYGQVHPVHSDTVQSSFNIPTSTGTRSIQITSGGTNIFNGSMTRSYFLGTWEFRPVGQNPYNQIISPITLRQYYTNIQNTYRVPSIQQQDAETHTFAGWDYGLTGGNYQWGSAQNYKGIVIDSAREIAYWFVPYIGKYDSLDGWSGETRKTRWILTPILGSRYDADAGTTSSSVANGYKNVVDFFWGGVLPEKEEVEEHSFDDEEIDPPANKGGNGTFQHSLETDTVTSNPAMSYTISNGYTNIYIMTASTLPNETNKLIDYNQSYKALLYHGLADTLYKDLKQKFAETMKQGALRLYALPIGLPVLTHMSDLEDWFVGGIGVGIAPLNDANWQTWWRGDPAGLSKARRVTQNEIDSFVDVTNAFHRFYDTFADYDPHTQATIFLPYIGWRSLPLTNLYGFEEIYVHYKIAILTGAVVAYIEGDGVPLETWTGNCAVDIPLTQTDITGILGSAYNAVAKTVAQVGGAVIGGIAGGVAGATAGTQLGAAVGGLVAAPEGNGRIDVNTTNPAGLEGLMLPQKIYITLHRTPIVNPEKFEEEQGWTANATTNIRKMHGYTEIDKIQLKCSATDEEKSEIMAILKSGVILP